MLAEARDERPPPTAPALAALARGTHPAALAARLPARAALPAARRRGRGLLALLALAVNGVYQLVRKPTELFFPVSGALYKTPSETWRDYGPLFRRYSTGRIEPELLAALAQVEGSGNPLVRTYWRWSWARQPFDVYRPASSAVGMYQITDGTFEVARHYCIHATRSRAKGRWNDFGSCWFNALYVRVLPGDAVELTAAYLDLEVANALALRRGRSAPSAGPPRRRRDAPVRRGCGGILRAAGTAFQRGREVRGSRPAELPGAGRRDVRGVRQSGGGGCR